MNGNKIFERIEKLFDVGLLSQSKVVIIGCGSGGGNVALQLAMSGIINFTLVDYDVLNYENVIRHVCGIKYLGEKKVDAVESVLLDRNPNIKVKKLNSNVIGDELIKNEILDSSVVILATDNENSRFYVNELCVNNKKAYVTARVFTRGIGGEVFYYNPNVGGCLACLENRLERTQYRSNIKEIDLLTDEEREKIYGMSVPEIKDSPGLNVDISFISSFHTRFVLEALFSQTNERPKYFPPIEENYLVWGNRPIYPFTKNFQIQRINLQKQEDCLVCSKKV